MTKQIFMVKKILVVAYVSVRIGDTTNMADAPNGPTESALLQNLMAIARMKARRCGIPRDQLEDAAQNAAVAVLMAARRYDPAKGTSLRSWLISAVHHSVHRSKLGAVPPSGSVYLDENDGHDTTPDREGPTPETMASRSEALGRVRRLPEPLRHVICARIAGRREEDIANELGVSQPRVAQLASEAIAAVTS